MPKKILSLGFAHEYGSLLHESLEHCRALAAAGYDAEVVDLSASDGAKRLSGLLGSGDVDFCFGLQGVGSCLQTGDGKNLWSTRHIPFIGLHYDHPAHNPFNHANASPWVGNIYYFESFLETKQRYLPSQQLSLHSSYGLLNVPPPASVPFDKRPYRLLYVKGGQALEELSEQIAALPPAIADGMRQQIERAAHSPELLLADLVEEILTGAGFTRSTHEKQFWGLVQMMDLYLRRKASIDFVEWLKMQDGAIIIGDGWDFIDRETARAQFRPSMEANRVFALYEQTKFTCNTRPYGRDTFHERIVYGLLMGGCVITDGNNWLKKKYGDIAALTFFDPSHSLDDQLQPALDEKKVQAAAENARQEALMHFDARDRIRAIPAFAEKIRLFAADATAQQRRA